MSIREAAFQIRESLLCLSALETNEVLEWDGIVLFLPFIYLYHERAYYVFWLL